MIIQEHPNFAVEPLCQLLERDYDPGLIRAEQTIWPHPRVRTSSCFYSSFLLPQFGHAPLYVAGQGTLIEYVHSFRCSHRKFHVTLSLPVVEDRVLRNIHGVRHV